MRPASPRTLCALLAAFSLPHPASSTQPQQPPPASSHKTPGAPFIASPSDVRDATTPNTTQSPHPETTPSITFTFSRPGVPIPHFTVTLAPNGQGHYNGEQVPSTTSSEPQSPPQPFNIDFTISPTTKTKIFTLSDKLNHFNLTCASSAKNIASSGTKTLRYTAPGAAPTYCTYDYSDNKDVQSLTQTLQAIAETIDQGRHLDFLHRYDRLALDEAISYLASEVSASRALELTTIAPILHSIADDPEVLQRVRTRATALLSTLPTPTPRQ